MTSTLDLEEVLEVVCRRTADALGVTSSYIYEYDPADRTMIWLAHFQRDASHGFEEPLGSVYPLDDLPQDKLVVETRCPAQVRMDDPELDPVMREQLIDWDEGCSLMVPLIIGDHVVGALEASEVRDTRHFTDDEVELCVALGEQAAVAIHNAQLYRQLTDQKRIIELQATTDGLTGLANHKTFFSRLRGEAARARRYGFSLTVLMLDLDDFKTVNDRFGHPAGDRVLKAVADVLRTQLRQNVDLPARYGGEEFAAVLPHTGAGADGGSLADAADGALATAERIRGAIAGVRLPGPRAPAQVTVSVGIATMPAHAADADELVSKADQALYAAKRAGKDRVEVWTGRG
jgi:diguanylate cyclase (GGDEF)-like protein